MVERAPLGYPPCGTPMVQPLTDAEKFYRDNAVRLSDLGGRMSLDEVQAVLDAARVALPDAVDRRGRWQLWTLIGLAEQRLDHNEAALAAHREALSLWPDDPQAAVNASKALGILGRPREALDMLERAERNLRGGKAMLPVILCNQVAALAALGDTGEADAAFERALAATPDDDAFGSLRLAVAAAVIDRDDDAAEYFARHILLATKQERLGRSATEVVATAPRDAISMAAQNEYLAPVLQAALARAALPPPPTEDERARAREASRDETGFVDPFALAEALSAPLHGVVRSDDPDARFGRDPQIRALLIE